MKKTLIILWSILLVGMLCFPAFADISSPVNPAISPVDLEPSTPGYQGYLYIPDSSTHKIKIKNITNIPPTDVGQISAADLGGKPKGMVLSADGSKLYVSVSDTDNVKVFDKNGVLEGAVSSHDFVILRGIALSPDGKRLYVADYSSSSRKVHVIETGNLNDNATADIYVGESQLFDVKVSPDNTMLAVLKRNASGKVFIYDIEHNLADGEITYSLNHTITGLYNPSHLAFSSDSTKLYVRVHDQSGSYTDVKVYNTAGFGELRSITVVSGSDYDPANPYARFCEPLGLSVNGEYLYVSHYKTSDGKVHAYRINTTDWGVQEMTSGLASPKDGLAAAPDGGRIWFTNSYGGYCFYTKWTGFTDGTGTLVNPIPGPVTIDHPKSPPNDLVNYMGDASWSEFSGDTNYSWERYNADYKKVGTTNWNELAGYIYDTETSLDSLTPGETYVVRVRKFGKVAGEGGFWGPFTYSQLFRMAKPTITSIEKNGEVVDGAYIYDSISIKGSGFGDRDLRTDPVDNDDFHIAFRVWEGVPPAHYSVDYIIPKVEGTKERITKWEDEQIVLVIPRKFKGLVECLAPKNYEVIVRAFGADSEKYNLTVGPVISSLVPNEGPVGHTVNVNGAGFGKVTTGDITQGNSKIYFHDGVEAAVTSWTREDDSDHIVCEVPSGAVDGRVKVVVNDIDSSPVYPGTNDNVIFDVTILPAPVIHEFQDMDDNVITDAFVYDTVRIIGENFGDDPGDGDRDENQRVTINGLTVRDDTGSTGLQVWKWSDDEIIFGIARRIGSTFIEAGANPVVVITPGGSSDAVNLNIKPRIYGISPSSGHVGDTGVVVSGTALEGTRTMYVGGVSATESSPIVRQDGADPDGAGGNDQITITIPSAPEGEQPVTATVNTQNSNTDIAYEILPLDTPNPLVVIPNVAPNTEPIEVHVHGTGFMSTSTVTLKKTGETDVVATGVTFIDATELVCTLDITGAALGKWDVVVVNGTKDGTISKGFTVVEGGDVAQIIDDFEGVAVEYPAGYTEMPADPDIDLSMSTTDVHEGDQAAAMSYPSSAAGWRGYSGNLAVMQDLSNFDTLSVMVKGDGSTNTAKLQITDIDGEIFASPATSLISLAGTTWTEYTIAIADLVEIDGDGDPIGDASDLNKNAVTNYQIIFMGDPASLATIKVDFVIAKGYTPPTEEGPITTTIVRAGDTVDSGVTISWVYNDDYVGNADIYAISGSYDAEDGVFTTDASSWGDPEFTNVSSPVTDNIQVGQGTQKYYKVVRTGVDLTDEMLEIDVAGKFDIGLTAGFNLISIPIILSDTSISQAVGTQLQAGAVPPLADKIYKQKADKSGYEQAWLNSADNQWYDAETMTFSTMTIELDKSYWVELAEGHASAMPTFVGKVSATNRSISITSGFNFTGTTFPVKVGIGSTNLRESGATAGAVPPMAAKVYSYKADKSGYDQVWLNSADNQWYDAETMTVSSMELKPGKGYIVEEVEGVVPYTWQYTKPY